jgi:hypothetical protein
MMPMNPAAIALMMIWAYPQRSLLSLCISGEFFLRAFAESDHRNLVTPGFL